jgi:hypothetical protein
MNKADLKHYITTQGGVQILTDIASILQELSQEWNDAGNKSLAYTFSDTSFMLADVANKLNIAQENYTEVTDKGIDYASYRLEFNKLMGYFQALSIKDLQVAYSKNKEEIISKLKRLEFLKRLLDIKDESKK